MVYRPQSSPQQIETFFRNYLITSWHQNSSLPFTCRWCSLFYAVFSMQSRVYVVDKVKPRVFRLFFTLLFQSDPSVQNIVNEFRHCVWHLTVCQIKKFKVWKINFLARLFCCLWTSSLPWCNQIVCWKCTK